MIVSEVLETREVNGVEYRVRLEQDQDCESPREDDVPAGVICAWSLDYTWPAEDSDQVTADRVRKAVGHYGQFGMYHEGRSFAAVSRWLRMFYGATIVLPLYSSNAGLSTGTQDETPEAGNYVGVTFDQPSTRKTTGIPTERMADALRIDVEQYAQWAEGDCYGYVIERKAENPHPDCHASHDDEDWQYVDSCWGMVGSKWAEESAREALASI